MSQASPEGSGDGERATLQRAAQVARAHAAAADRTAQFVAGLSEVPDAADLAEYANLLAREEVTMEERNDALRAAGLDVESLDSDDS